MQENSFGGESQSDNVSALTQWQANAPFIQQQIHYLFCVHKMKHVSNKSQNDWLDIEGS